jgi:hypothetical protein
MDGPVAQQLTMTLANPSKTRLRGPVRVAVMCFGEARTPALLASAHMARTSIRPDASVPASVDLHELCPSYLVGATVG